MNYLDFFCSKGDYGLSKIYVKFYQAQISQNGVFKLVPESEFFVQLDYDSIICLHSYI